AEDGSCRLEIGSIWVGGAGRGREEDVCHIEAAPPSRIWQATSANAMTAFVPEPPACEQSGTAGAAPEAISGGSRDAWIFRGCGRQMRLQRIRTRRTFDAGLRRFDGLTDN